MVLEPAGASFENRSVRVGKNRIEATMYGSATAGFSLAPKALVPAINWEYELDLRIINDILVRYTVSGWHNNMPSYEIVMDGNLVYGFQTAVTNVWDAVLGLLPLSRHKFSTAGFLIRDD